jgi:hypothetical protein
MTQEIAILYCFPRSGGTVLNQCLLCGEGTVVLSEINPADSVLPPEYQAAEWFRLLSPLEATRQARKSYVSKIALIHRRAQAQQKRLCIRDWCAVNFLPGISPFTPRPSLVLEQRHYLRAAGFTLREAVLLRRSRSLYDSLRLYISPFSALSPRQFAQLYRPFLRATARMRRFYLEDFRREPTAILDKLCNCLNLSFPNDFTERFHSITTVTGNTTLATHPESASWRNIRPASHSFTCEKDDDSEPFSHLDKMAGYHDHQHD